MKTVNHRLFFFFLLIFNSSFFTPAYSQGKEIILQPGNPPLTQSIVNKTIEFLEWTLDGKFSRPQAIKLQQFLVSAWKNNNRQEIQSTLDMLEVYEQTARLNDNERANAKAQLQTALLDNIKKQPDDEMGQLLLAVYNAVDPDVTTTTATGNTGSVKNKLRVGTDGFTGIYRMLRPKALNINNSGYESGYYIEYITFLPGGKLYWALPPEGLLYFDESVAQRADAGDWGSYVFKGNEIHVLRGPDKTKYVITRNGERLNNPPSLGKGSFRPVPNCDGLKLEGNYRRHESEPVITFTTDGKFQDGGVFGYFGTRARLNGSIYQDDGKGGAGSYIIEQNTLELRYTDGRVKHFPFLAFPENLAMKPAVESFLIHNDRLERF